MIVIFETCFTLSVKRFSLSFNKSTEEAFNSMKPNVGWVSPARALAYSLWIQNTHFETSEIILLVGSCLDTDLFLCVSCGAHRGLANILLKALLCIWPWKLVEWRSLHRTLLPRQGYQAFPLLSFTCCIKAASILSRRDSIPRMAYLQLCF